MVRPFSFIGLACLPLADLPGMNGKFKESSQPGLLISRQTLNDFLNFED